jgi:hypothetical protein
MAEAPRTPPPLWVERFLSNTLSDAERAAFMTMTTEVERARLRAEHEALREELLRERSPAEFARVVHARAEAERVAVKPAAPLARGLLLASLTAGVALVASDLLLRSDVNDERAGGRPLSAESERAKGLAPSLRVYRRRAEGAQLLAHGERVAPGDVLQLGYVAPGMSHAVLLSIDGRAQVTLHSPTDVEASTKLGAAQGERLLPSAYELDDAPGFERFVLVTSRRALRASDVVRAAQALARAGAAVRDTPLALPAQAEQVSVLLDKGGP